MTRLVGSIAIVVFLVLHAAAPAQNLTDPFNYPAGTTIPGYTEQRGDWVCTGSAVQSQAGVTFQELTRNGITDQNASAEVLAIYNLSSPGLQYVGPIVRYTGQGASANYFMVKVQDNAAPYTGWDYCYVYFYNGASFTYVMPALAINPPTTMARVRLQVADEPGGVRVNMFIDTDLDGLWNITGEALFAQGAGTQGTVGVCAYQSAIADDLKYFSGTLRAGGIPVIGTSVSINGTAGTATTLLYFGACSLGHAGIPIPPAGTLPLTFDALLNLSLSTPSVFQNFSGYVAASGAFSMTLNVPAIPSLSGLVFWTAALTYDGVTFPDFTPDLQLNIP